MGDGTFAEPEGNDGHGECDEPFGGIDALGDDLSDGGGEDHGHNRPCGCPEEVADVHLIKWQPFSRRLLTGE